MARRTHMVLGRGEKSRLNRLLGLIDRNSAHDILKELWQLPKLDYDAMEGRCGCTIPGKAKDKIQGEYEDLVVFQLVEVLPDFGPAFQQAFGALDRELMPHREFNELLEKLRKRAAKLREALDELVKFDPELAFPPRDTREEDEFPSRFRYSVEQRLGSFEPVFRADDNDFLEYLNFRKTLDYLEHFEDKNQRFNNWYSSRWTDETDHNLFELLARRVIVALRTSGFSMSLTVPTDVAPEYESPCISVLLSIQDTWNTAMAPAIEKRVYSSHKLSYRQMLYLTSKVLEDIENLEQVFANLAAQNR